MSEAELKWAMKDETKRILDRLEALEVAVMTRLDGVLLRQEVSADWVGHPATMTRREAARLKNSDREKRR